MLRNQSELYGQANIWNSVYSSRCCHLTMLPFACLVRKPHIFRWEHSCYRTSILPPLQDTDDDDDGWQKETTAEHEI